MIVYFYLPSVFLRARKKYDVLSFLCLGFFHQSDKRARLGWGHLVACLRLPGQQVSAGHLGKFSVERVPSGNLT